MIIELKQRLQTPILAGGKARAGASRQRLARGFTLMELLIVMAVMGIIAAFMIPAFQTAVRRAQLSGYTQAVALNLRKARLEAIKRSQQVGVQVDPASGSLITFVDVDGSCSPNAGDILLHIAVDFAPSGAFIGPNMGDSNQDELFGFNETTPACPVATPPAPPDPNFPDPPVGGWAIFDSSGSVFEVGAFRFGDSHENYLEVRVEPRATGKVQTRKWDATLNIWLENNRGGKTWDWL